MGGIFMMKFRPSRFLVLAALAGCNNTDATQAQSNVAQPQPLRAEAASANGIERALLDQISCKSPPQAGVAMSAMLRQQLIARTEDGGDGIRLFVPVSQMSLLGFPVVRLSGWQADPEGGAMKPFERGPGTAPPNHISITVKASEEEVREALIRLGIVEARYVPDESQEAWVGSDGKVVQPERLIPGPAVAAGDDEMASNPVAGTTTIACSAEAIDFDREVKAQFEAR